VRQRRRGVAVHAAEEDLACRLADGSRILRDDSHRRLKEVREQKVIEANKSYALVHAQIAQRA
jgi:hypothetical protein